MKNMRSFLKEFENEALHELAFTYERSDYVDFQSELLAHRTPEEINCYLLSRIYKLRQMCNRKLSIRRDELYVVFRGSEPDAVDCTYLYGEMYHNPLLLFPMEEDLRKMWEYAWTIAPGPFTCEFDRFVEKQVAELLKELHKYESLLEGEIILLPYALRPPQGIVIHNALYAKAKEFLDEISEKRELLARSGAPQYMQDMNARVLCIAKEVLQILGSAKIPNTH